MEILSHDAPITGYSFPSYFAVKVLLIAPLSFLTPDTVCLTPPAEGSFTRVKLVIGFEIGVLTFDLAMLRLQVPSELSAPNIPIAVMAVPIASLARIILRCFSL